MDKLKEISDCEHEWNKSTIEQGVAFCSWCPLELPLKEVCEHKKIIEVAESCLSNMNGLEHKVPVCFDCDTDLPW